MCRLNNACRMHIPGQKVPWFALRQQVDGYAHESIFSPYILPGLARACYQKLSTFGNWLWRSRSAWPREGFCFTYRTGKNLNLLGMRFVEKTLNLEVILLSTIRDFLRNDLGLTEDEVVQVAVRLAERRLILGSATAAVSSTPPVSHEGKKWGQMSKSEREAAILIRLNSGMSYAEAAKQLGCVHQSIRSFVYYNNLKSKIKVSAKTRRRSHGSQLQLNGITDAEATLGAIQANHA